MTAQNRPVEFTVPTGATPEVGRSAAHPSLCGRCEDAVESGLVCR